MKRFSHKQWIWLGIIFLFIFIGIQFIGPAQETPAITSVIRLPDPVQQVIVKSCFDCHTSFTKFSWFDRIAPASWVVRDHVRKGRKLVNFSQWDSLSKDQQKVVLFESLNQMRFRVMPLEQYAFIHPSSRPSAEDINSFQAYLSTLVSPYSPDTVKTNKWREQYASWRRGGPDNQKVAPSLNGIVFNPDYKNWVAISSTERFDNGTMRVIVGNPIAVKAVKEKQTNPWPDGSVIVKILWISVIDSAGTIHAGALRQLDYMIKDREKYAETAGWGFARWVGGLELKPYGKNVLFASECVRCHQSMQKNDFVFTDPINIRTDSSLEGKVISSFIDGNARTMSTLYGNDLAIGYVRSHSGFQYPAGSKLTLATWKQKEDDHWFGARIPGERQMIEKVFVRDSFNGKRYFVYQRFTSSSWGKVIDQKPEEKELRVNFILNQPASVMP